MPDYDFPHRSDARAPLLSVTDLSVRFGGVVAVDSISFAVERGDTLGLVGPNGAGKTTTFNAVTGMVKAAGSAHYDGREILGLPPYRIAKLGIARTFQHVATVPELSVKENIRIGTFRHGAAGWLRSSTRVKTRSHELHSEERTDHAIDTMGLGHIAHRACSDLGLPNLKLVEIARAIAFGADLLLLDEPANGLTHSEVAALSDNIKEIQAQHGLSIILVEHHMGLVRRLANALVVLDFGQILATGDPTTVLESDAVVRAYMGGEV